MNREICGGGGASIYPLAGDVSSTAGSPLVTVIGIQGIGVQSVTPSGGEVLTYDNSSGTIFLAAPSPTLALEVNSTPNSSQTLLNLIAGSNVTITDGGSGNITIAATAGTASRSATITNANGSYWTWSDGIIEQWGSITLTSTGTNKNGGTITFPTVFPTALQSIQVTMIGLPNSGATDSAAAQVGSFTGSGAIVDVMCSVPTGGGGVSFNQSVEIHWRAIGN